MMNRYNVFDFDGTIYDGDSSVDFFIFILRKYPICSIILPRFMYCVVAYKLKRCTKEQLKECFFSFLRFVKDVDYEVECFWKVNGKKFYKWYIERDHKHDVIISASPEFLIRPIVEQYGVYAVIATHVDKKTGRFIGKNCYGEEKVLRLKNELGSKIQVETFYSDSKSDLPLAKIAEKAYFVNNKNVSMWKF